LPDFEDRATAVRAGEELNLEALESYLQAHLPNERGPLDVKQFPSGHSNLTYSVCIGNSELVLRRPPFGSKVKSAHDMGREFRVLSKLHAVYPQAPEVVLYCDDVSVLGAPFYMMKPIHGVIIRRNPPAGLEFTPENAQRLSEAFVDNLARLHSLDYLRIGLGDLGKPEGYLERQVRGWTERYYGSRTHEFPEVERIVSWMKEHMPPASSAALVHNDYKYDNLVLDPSDITKIIGVLDWEMCTIGDPLTDLGTVLAYWVDPDDPEPLQNIRWGPTTHPGSMTRAQIVERYAKKIGRNVSHVDFYLAFARFKVAVIVQQIYYRYHQGLTKDERFAAMPAVVEALLRASLHCAETGVI
jgi:aminoglycoside phosphotransferase (APT) family kinase protein